MKRSLRFLSVFAIVLALTPFFPFYIKRTMIRSWEVSRAGDVIEFGWQFSTLRSYWNDYSFLRPEQQPEFWLVVNLALAVIYAFVTALCVDQALTYWKRRQERIR